MPETLGHRAAKRPYKVLSIGGDASFHKRLARLLKTEANLQLCASARSAGEALSQLAQTNPDLVVIDLTLAEESGLQLIKRTRKTCAKTKLLAVSDQSQMHFVNRVLRLGADGYLRKKVSSAEIIYAILDVLKGHIYISEEIFSHSPKSKRPAREKQRSSSSLENK